ncbi:hypothetical protein AAG596_09705 [Citromicrobium bathyomarinum]|uniref:hypothetical protein n=1 Tax=Citromicrobium bathyomarinum TaxID=72174 RepID=UPI00315A8002
MNERLFSDLFAYRPRIREGGAQDRSPLEDWLTECLAASLRALVQASLTAGSEALATLSGAPSDAICAAIRTHGLVIQTQHHAGVDGRPDMVFWLGDWPWLVVENKVDHTASLSQLAGYARWQADHEPRKSASIRADTGLQPAIVFITHITRAPEGFVSGTAAFADVKVVATRWPRVAKLLSEKSTGLCSDSFALRLAQAFHCFLKDQHMANEYPTTRAVSAAELFMEEGAQLVELADHMLAQGECIGNFYRQTTTWARPRYSHGLFYAERPANDIVKGYSGNFATGFWFPEIGSYGADIRRNFPKETISDAVKVFVTVEGEALVAATDSAPPGWLRDGDEFLAFADFASFNGTPDERGQEILEWTKRRCEAFRDWAESQG